MRALERVPFAALPIPVRRLSCRRPGLTAEQLGD
jgi:hypothetical protein